MDANLKVHLIWIIALLGFVTLVGTFVRMRPGFNLKNLWAVCIVLVIIFITLLSVAGVSNYVQIILAGGIGASLGFAVAKANSGVDGAGGGD